jgi:hypothetical protein
VAAAAGSACAASRSPPGCAPSGAFVTVRSSEFHAQNVWPSETSVRSPESVGSWTRPRPSPSDHTRAVLEPFAACGMPGSAGRPRALSSSTSPPNAGGSAASTELTRSSGETGGSSGCAPAPPGVASSPNPTAPATAMPAATVRPVLALRPVAMDTA